MFRSGVMLDAAKATGPGDTVPFARSFVASEAFKHLFREGMTLVESTAAYLDGPGREASKSLARDVSLTYASESMRLTTRLMQAASWLLLQRAVSEGELTIEQARNEKRRVRLTDSGSPSADEHLERLPDTLRELIAHSIRLQARILHLEKQMDDAENGTEAPVANPLQLQMERLSQAFGPR
jgi:regulator of CtrA degradation